jgi:DNA-binding Lrp family transcriptional regulator
MKRAAWLNTWKKRRQKMLREHRGGMSWNQLAKKYNISVGTVGRRLKQAKEEEIW